MPEYTVLAVLSVIGTVLAEALWLHTGIFRRAKDWIAMVIVYCFHVLVDGWLTKLSAPIVIYDEGQITGVRVPWDIPVEDYLFGFAMITLTLMLWVRLGQRDDALDGTDRTELTGLTDRTTTQETP
jgi:lycopene cyclase domain-containing protein